MMAAAAAAGRWFVVTGQRQTGVTEPTRAEPGAVTLTAAA